MNDIKEIVKHYCAVIEADCIEGVCDMGFLSPKKGTGLLKDGGYKVAIMVNGEEIVSGFSPINESEGITDKTIAGAYRSLIYALIQKTVTSVKPEHFNPANTVVKK